MMAVSIPSSVVIEGAILGLNYGLLATGLVLIYRTNRVINFAQGQLGVVAAVFLVKLYYDYGINYWAALVAALVLAAAVGALSELLLRRLFNRPRVMVMVATIGLSQVLFLFTLFPFIRPKKLFRAFPVPVDWSFHIGTFLFPPGEVVTLIVAPIVALGLAAFIRFSPWGLAMRASAENSESARLSGVWVRRTSTVAWTLAGALSAFTAILASPSQTSTLTEVLSPGLLLLALLAALIGGMVSLPVAFVAGIGIGIVQDLLQWNITNPTSGSATVELVIFLLLLLALLVRASSLQKGTRTAERTSWTTGTLGFRNTGDALRKRVGTTGVMATVVVAALLPLVLDVGHSFLMSQICIYGVIALSLTVLTGWAGQVSLGQFGLVAVGADMAAHLGGSVPLILLLPFAGVVTGIVSMLVGLTALRIRGLYLAVSTLGFALFMQTSVLATSCWTVPLIHRTICSGLPDPQSTLISRPTLFGLGLSSERAFAWFSLAVLIVSVLMVRLWRDRGIARRLISVRDNEVAAGSAGIPVVRTKLMAFALSGFMAGYAGVCFAFATERFSTDTFDPTISILVVSMVVIGGIDAIPGAVLGALYLVGLPAIFGASTTVQFLTSGFGLMAFILYLPGGMAEVMHRFGDLVTAGVVHLQARWRGDSSSPPEAPHPIATIDPVTGKLTEKGAVAEVSS
ncbi:MAG: ABC transporter permease [Acidimicrobiales bacterium]|jgi:ABC-type branched-subunit amino acid transport system permease subunit